MRRFLPFAALLGVALVLGCQEKGTGPVGPDGVVPQFALDCDAKPDHPNCSPKDKPGGGGGVNTLDVNFTADPGFGATDPTLILTDPTGGGGFLIDPIQPTGSGLVMISGYSVTKVKAGKIMSVKVWVAQTAPLGSADNDQKWHSDDLPVDPPVSFDSAPVTIHLHADGVELFRGKDRGAPSIGTISIADVVYTPAP